MKFFRIAVLAFVPLMASLASADSIQIFQITNARIDMFPGNEAYIYFSGPGISISGGGFLNCNAWCDEFTPVPAGFTASFSSVDITGYDITIKGVTYYNVFGEDLLPFNINLASDIVVPDCCANATLNSGLIFGEIDTGSGILHFGLKIPAGIVGLGFVPSDEGGYSFIGGSFTATATVPEPSTVGFMTTGLVAVVCVARRKTSHWRRLWRERVGRVNE